MQTQRVTVIHQLLETHTKKAHNRRRIPMLLWVQRFVAAASFAWLGFGQPAPRSVYSTLAPAGPSGSNRIWLSVSFRAFQTCCKQVLMTRSIGWFHQHHYSTLRRRRGCWRGWRCRAAWIHRGTGWGRRADPACHSTAEGERRQRLAPFSITGELLLSVKEMLTNNTLLNLKFVQFWYCSTHD